jgi:ubiquinone/menaquinone biosynthesis C-methylase UbiE
MQTQQRKAWKGMAMEGFVADWYARNTGKDLSRFEAAARAVEGRATPGARVLEVAPGPGYLALELARRGFVVTGLDASRSFVRMARENAARAGLDVAFEQGDAAHLPFPDSSFDHAVCLAAFKNFTDPVGAIDELHRVLRPGGMASIVDLRRDAPLEAIEAEVAGMKLTPLNALLTRLTFRFLLLRNAYGRDALERMVARSRFGRAEIVDEGIGIELRLAKPLDG